MNNILLPIIRTLSLTKRSVTVTITKSMMDEALTHTIQGLKKDKAYVKNMENKAAATGKFSHLRSKEVPEEFLQYNFEQIAPGVLDELLQKHFGKIRQQENFTPLGPYQVESPVRNLNGDFIFEIQFDVSPNPDDICIDLPYIGLEKINITEEDIQSSIEHLRIRHIEWSEVNSPAQTGDQITIDLQGEMDGKPFAQGTAKDMKIALGMDMMMDGFQEQLLNLKNGDKKVFDLAYPQNYPDSSLAGKMATFYVEVKKVCEPVMPEVNETLIKKCGIDSGKLEDLIAKIRENLLRHKTSAAKHQLKQKVFNSLLEKNPFDAPKQLVTEEQKRVETQCDIRPDAERTVRLSLLLGALIQKFQLTPDLDRVKTLVNEAAMLYKDAESVRQSYYKDENKLRDLQMIALEDQIVEKLESINK